MMQLQVMNNEKSNMCRQFAQEAFEESLNALQQLSLEPGETLDAETNPSEDMISWDEVADDLEHFFEDLMVTEESNERPPEA